MADPAAPALIDLALLDHLARYDTPTICNALEVATGGRRATGFTREQMVSAFPSLPPMVGFARTATLRASAPSSMSAAEQREMRLAYYEYVASTPGDRIHADRHGAVVVPIEAALRPPAAIGTVIKREKLILDAAAQPGFSVADIRRALSEGDDIH